MNETKITLKMLKESNEIFSTGNFGKIMYLNNLDGITLKPGIFYKKLKKAYWDYSSNFLL